MNHNKLYQQFLDAVIKGAVSQVHHLLELEAPVNAAEPVDGNTALHLAVINGNEEMIKLLLSFGADVAAQNRQGVTPIQLAAAKNKWLCVVSMADQRPTDTEDRANYGSALLFAVKANLTEVALLLLHEKAPITWHVKDSYDTCLHWATRNKNQQLAKTLILSGADVDKKNRIGETPLHIAARNGDTAMTLLLLHNEASLNAVTHAGQNPIEIAMKENHLECAREMESFKKISSLPEKAKDYFYEMTLNANLTNPVITEQGTTYQYEKLIQFGSDPQTRAKLTEGKLLHNKIVDTLLDHYSKPGVDMNVLPGCLCCPLTGKLFVDPVVAVDGETYERKSIELYLKEHANKTPKGSCQNKMALYPNRFVSDLIQNKYADVLKTVETNVEPGSQLKNNLSLFAKTIQPVSEKTHNITKNISKKNIPESVVNKL